MNSIEINKRIEISETLMEPGQARDPRLLIEGEQVKATWEMARQVALLREAVLDWLADAPQKKRGPKAR